MESAVMMKNEKISLSIDELEFWRENPREFFDPNFTDDEIIEHYTKHEKLDILKEDIERNGLSPTSNFIILYEEEEKIVYDGNRRLAALKKIGKPAIVSCIRVFSKADAFDILDREHSGENGGIGVVSWDPLQRDRFLLQQNKQPLYPKAINFLNIVDKNIKRKNLKNYIEYSTLERLLGFDYVVDLLQKYDEEHVYKIIKKLGSKKRINSRNSNTPLEFLDNFGSEISVLIETIPYQTELSLNSKKSHKKKTNINKKNLTITKSHNKTKPKSYTFLKYSNSNIKNIKDENFDTIIQYAINNQVVVTDYTNLPIKMVQVSFVHRSIFEVSFGYFVSLYKKNKLNIPHNEHKELMKIHNDLKSKSYNTILFSAANFSILKVLYKKIVNGMDEFHFLTFDKIKIDVSVNSINASVHGKPFMLTYTDYKRNDELIKSSLHVINKIIDAYSKK